MRCLGGLDRSFDRVGGLGSGRSRGIRSSFAVVPTGAPVVAERRQLQRLGRLELRERHLIRRPEPPVAPRRGLGDGGRRRLRPRPRRHLQRRPHPRPIGSAGRKLRSGERLRRHQRPRQLDLQPVRERRPDHDRGLGQPRHQYDRRLAVRRQWLGAAAAPDQRGIERRPLPARASNGAEQLWTNAWPGTGQWVHWAVVLSESTDTAELFINGASKGTRTVSQAYATTPGSFEAGASGSTNNPFDGRLDEVAVYEHGLSAARIAAHHDAGLGSGFVSQKRTQTNGGVWLSWSSVAGSSFPITAEGTTQVEARVSGNDASVSGSASQTVKIDKSTPTPVLSCP